MDAVLVRTPPLAAGIPAGEKGHGIPVVIVREEG